MKTKLINLYESVRTSMWLIPSVMVCSVILLSVLMGAIDRKAVLDTVAISKFLYAGKTEGARSILSVIGGSMITVAGVTFSITIVSLTLAASQFGSRLLRNFMKDVYTQIVLGTFISTFIYCLIVLQMIHTQVQDFTPGISVTFAIILAITNVGILVYFFHHISISIQADQVISVVSCELEEKIKQSFPETLKAGATSDKDGAADLEFQKHTARQIYCINAPKSGYLLSIDMERLLNLAARHDLGIRILYRPGQFVVAGQTLSRVGALRPPEQSLAQEILDTHALGSKRTPVQDPEYVIDQLVEIAVRSLSPGINDPFTAITCIDRLGSAMCMLAGREFPCRYHFDSDKTLRLSAEPVTFSGLANAAFDQIRRHGQSSVFVSIRLLETWTVIAGCVRCPEQRDALLRHATAMTEHAAEDKIWIESDRKDILDRCRKLLTRLNQGNHAIQGAEDVLTHR